MQLEEMRLILKILLKKLIKRLAEREIGFELTDAAAEYIANEGYNPAFGARPLKRAIQQLLENPLSQSLLRGDFSKGDTIRVDFTSDNLSFSKG